MTCLVREQQEMDLTVARQLDNVTMADASNGADTLDVSIARDGQRHLSNTKHRSAS